MKRIINLNQERRQLLFEAAAREMKVSSVVVEKDFWVCVVLNYLMNESKYKDFFIFKGGTSLSKCYGVINRFSEDIDLIVKWDKIGFSDKDVYLERSKNQDYKFETLMNEKGAIFIQHELKDDLINNLVPYIKGMRIESDSSDPMVLLVYYPTSYNDPYIQQAIKLEIGPVASKTPIEVSNLRPYCYKALNDNDKESIPVTIVTIARTFWEKLLILFAERNRPSEKKTPSRYSRHYYDVYMIYKSPYFQNIIKQKDLFQEVKLFKSKYYRTSWSNIENSSLENIQIIPSNERLKFLESDYKQMTSMIFGNAPDFKEIMNGLKELEKDINQYYSK